MTKKLCLLTLVMFVFALSDLNAQDDTWTTAKISDEMTTDSDQNKKWRMGQYQFAAKPKNAWELGIAVGHFHVNGDVPSDMPSGYGVGLHLRKAINYILSWRIEGMYSSTTGLDGRLSNYRVLNLDNKSTNLSQNTYRNFQTNSFSGGISGIVNIGNLLFHSPRNKWNAYLGVGFSLTSTEVKMDYLNGSTPYDWSAIESAHNSNSRQKRNDIRAALDGVYETIADNDRDVPSILHDNGLIFPSFLGTVGVSRKINKRVNISLEQQMIAQDFDKWDGHQWREADSADGGGDQTNDSDIASFTSIRIGVNLGNFDNVTEPLYWLNPLDATYNDIAELKQRPVLDLTDADNDGIIDMLDQELDSPAGCPVDTRGIVLDSDGDGLADCKDKEPFFSSRL